MKYVSSTVLNETRKIKIEDCQPRKLYLVDARRMEYGLGVCSSAQCCDNTHQVCIFIGIREKFGRRFLSSENHWDEPHSATAIPLEILGELPEDITCNEFNNPALFAWLEEQIKNPELIEKLKGYSIPVEDFVSV